MPAPHMFIDVPATRANGDAFAGIADMATDLCNRYKENLASYGDYEGRDEFGVAYDDSVKKPIGASVESLGSLPDTFKGVGGGLVDTADLLGTSNDVNTHIAGPLA
jgi:hypothetical protein